ncbi:Hint domain-containing protein [Sulfitobacter marinus]|uniref:Hint domain-containing protein n=2 Tax=Sulfitobacter marinus TaxID=394264 RepID=A0A1I6QM75_9RHOB|nr:Hint domain-containing protein [Sulfitobacter marinus]
MPTIYLWQISDITSSGPDVFSNTMDGNDGAVGVSTFSINGGSTKHAIDVVDNDANLENDDATSQDIASAVSFDGASFSPGDNIQVEYSYIVRVVGSSDPADNITAYGIRMDNTLHGVATDAPLVPGLSYDVLSIVSNSPTVPYSEMVVCFTAGTLILTDQGETPIENLTVGSMVKTLHHGVQPIRWIRKRRIFPEDLSLNPNLRPIKISKGALDNEGVPACDLIVSPQHRILISSKIADRMFHDSDMLIPAKKLLPLPGVEIVDDDAHVEYWHFICDDHQVVFANGTPTETLFLGAEALKALPDTTRAEISLMFPEFGLDRQPKPAAPLAKGLRSKMLVQRHLKNRKPILSDAFTRLSR